MEAEGGFEVLTTEDEWVKECDGNMYCPKLRCVKCGDVVTSTSIANLTQGQGIGCSCRKRTEGKLRKWLEKTFPAATVDEQYRGPTTSNTPTGRVGQTKFDFHLTFSNDFKILVELDGPQHFWEHLKYYTGRGCERDLVKEEWAIAKGLSVVRVLQGDVWNDLRHWEQHLTRSIEAARVGHPRVFTPADVPEYTSENSAYVQHHIN